MSDSASTISRRTRRGSLLDERVPLLNTLPELADHLAPEQLDVAYRILARTIAVRRGAWDAVSDAIAFDAIGFVVLSGTIVRVVSVGHREGAELLGPGDLVQPQLEGQGRWRALEATVLVPLEPHLMVQASRMPSITSALIQACTTRTNAVARQLVIAQWSSVDDRIVAVLRILADRWGVVTPGGVVLPDWLTHSTIAPLVGARRPSVTTALKRLDKAGLVVRQSDGRWLLGDA